MRIRDFVSVVFASLAATCVVGAGYLWSAGSSMREPLSPRFVGMQVTDSVVGVQGDGLDEGDVVAGSASTEVVPSVPHGGTVVVVGDIMLSRNVAAATITAGDWTWPFQDIAGIVSDADVSFANLETAVTPGRVIKPLEMSFRADPEALEGLTFAGFDIVSLANNHTPNFGERGVIDTVRYLDDVGIKHAGAGATLADAVAPAVTDVGGVRVAWLAWNDADVVPTSYGASDTRAGTAIMDAGRMADAVRAARDPEGETRADVVLVSMHSGTEYALTANSRQRTFAHAAIDAGADAVIGHHPHVVQPIEVYKGKPILYSLGNFVFDQWFSAETRDGLVAKLRIGPSGVERMDFIPVHDFSGKGRVSPADDAARKRVFARLRAPETGMDFAREPSHANDGSDGTETATMTE